MPAQPEPENKIAKIKRQKALAWLKRVAYENPCMKEVKTCIEVLSAPAQPAMPVQEIVGWIFEDELPKNYPYDAMCPHSKVDVVRMFPVFAPSAAQSAIQEQAKILGYFSFDPEDGAEILKDRQTAIDNCNASIDLYRESMQEEYPDGWSDDVKRVCWGVILQEARGFDAQGIPEDDPNHTYQTLDYRLAPDLTTAVTAQPVSEPKLPNSWIKGQFAYQDLFNAIGAAVVSKHPSIEISVKAFEASMLASADLERMTTKRDQAQESE